MKEIVEMKRMMCAVLAAGLLAVSCGMSKSAVEKNVKKSFQETMAVDKNYGRLRLTVDSVQLVKVADYLYEGQVNVRVFGQPYRIAVMVSADGDAVQWEASGEALSVLDKAHIVETGDMRFQLTREGEGFELIKYTGEGNGAVNIPREIGGVPVIRIWNGAFTDSGIQSVTIPASVTEIGAAFSSCTSLASITIPDSVTVIKSGAFYGCTSLVSITIPDSVTQIEESAFHDCTSLASITIPQSVTSIGMFAFS
ncbi:MAG: leucine-rich repeat domain-containing protein [Treponema sp.]|jgi:hypothetical protein|nr:leucine-rich repeat domain-containing protein [Treponema sp.]